MPLAWMLNMTTIISAGKISKGYRGFQRLLSVAVLTVVVTLILVPESASASTPFPTGSNKSSNAVELPKNLTREEVRDLVARMSDDEVRELIINQLDKLAEPAQKSNKDTAAAYISQVTKGLNVATKSLERVFTSADDIYRQPELIWQQVSDYGNISGRYMLFQLVGLLLAGWLVERLFKHFLKNIGRNVGDVSSMSEKLSIVLLRAVLGILAIGGFVAGAEIFLTITDTGVDAAKILWEQIILFIVTVKFALLIVNLLVAPGEAMNRMIPIGDYKARAIRLWTLVIMISLTFPLTAFLAELGTDSALVLMASIISGAVFIAVLIALVIRLRGYGAGLISGSQKGEGSAREGLARIWWLLAIGYILLIWLMAVGKRAATGESSLTPGLGSLVLFALIPYLDLGLQKLIDRFFIRKADPEKPVLEQTIDDTGIDSVLENEVVDEEQVATDIIYADYMLTALRYARVLLTLVILAVFVSLWDINLQAIVAQLLGQRISTALFDISLTLILIWAVWGVIRIAFERKISEEQAISAVDEEGGGDGGGLGGTRLETVLPIFRIFVKITMIVMAVMLSLSALGVDIGPLIAGAGVIGIAIGFGAQTLVRDIVSGLFFLLDDAFRVGEYVSIDAIRGTVERISIRSFQLRHHNGMVHTIPYGEIKSLTNYSRDWAIMKFELRVPYETDIDLVRKIIKNLGKEMKEDPVFGANMLEPLKSQGVNRMDDSALIIRCKFTAVPGQQFLIRREAFTRIQKAFEENGIHFAPRRVLVESVAPADGSAVTAAATAAAMAAAAGAMDQELPGGGKGGSSDR